MAVRCAGRRRSRQGALTGTVDSLNDRWGRVERLFEDALALPPTAREAFLDAECGDDGELRHRLASLLAAHDALATQPAGHGFLDALDSGRAAALLGDPGADAAADPHLDPDAADPAAIGRYGVIRRLGRGGMGIVYLARDPDLDRPVALKLLPPELAADAAASRRLLHEARSASALDHPNIATVYEIGETDDRRPFIAMAYYEGDTLRHRIAGGAVPIDDAVEIAAQIADGLTAAHGRQIVHRDIKPENVIITPQGLVKIVDFGVAKVAAAALTRTGGTMGTVAYMSPEQTRGAPVDGRTDIWALGVVLFEMLTGARPFRGAGSDAVIYAIRNDPIEAIESLRPDVPRAVARIVERCLEKDPERRFSSPGELAAALRQAAAETGGTATGLAGMAAAAPRGAPWQAAVYVPVAWVGYHAVQALTRVAGLPGRVPAIALVLFLVGFTVVIATALAQRSPRDRPGQWGALGRRLTWRRATAGGVVAFGILATSAVGYTGMRSLGIGPPGTLTARGMLTDRDPIVLADFATDAADTRIGRVVTEALRIDLLQSPALRLAESSEVAAGLRRMTRDLEEGVPEAAARELAQREGFKAVIAGEVSALGGGYVLAARVVAAADGATLAAVRETARDSTELIDAVDRLSKRVRERIGESLRSLHAAQPLPRVATASLPALRTYAEASQLATAGGDEARIASLLEEAVALDSMFAAAHRGLAATYWNMRADHLRRVTAMQRAYELRDRLSERERLLIEATYYFGTLGDPGRAAAVYRRVLALDPEDPAAINNLGLSLMFLDRPAEAEAVLRQGVGPSAPAVIRMNVADALYFQDRTAAALAVLDSGTVEVGENPMWEIARARILGAAGRWAEAEAVAQAALERYAGNSQVRIAALRSLWHLALVQGRLREAERYYVELEPVLEEAGAVEALARAVVQRAELWQTVVGDTDRSRAELDSLLNRPSLDVLTVGATIAPRTAAALAAGGDTARAARLVDAWVSLPEESRGDPDAFSPELARARIDLAAGRPDAAVDRLQRATVGNIHAVNYLPDLAYAHELAGEPDSAIAVLERYLTYRHSRRLHRIPGYLGPALLRLGDLYEDAGETDRAVGAYGQLVELWRDADPELQPRVEHARRRIAALTGAGGR
jgi:eukaryotic-like serine/threonine-protein kinase